MIFAKGMKFWCFFKNVAILKMFAKGVMKFYGFLQKGLILAKGVIFAKGVKSCGFLQKGIEFFDFCKRDVFLWIFAKGVRFWWFLQKEVRFAKGWKLLGFL